MQCTHTYNIKIAASSASQASSRVVKLKQPISPEERNNQPAVASGFRQMFSNGTKAIVWGMQTRAVQSMLDFDFICR